MVRRHVDPAQLEEAVRQMAVVASDEGVAVALTGGFAMQLYGSDRFTADIDLLANELLRSVPVEKMLSFGGQQTHAPNGIPVDVIVRTDDYLSLYNEALDQSVLLPSFPVHVVTPEYLVAMKMAAGRPKDLLDLDFLLLNPGMDFKAATKIVRTHLGLYAARELRMFKEEAQWKASREP